MLKKGSHITAYHQRSGRLLHYRIVEDKTDNSYKLVNLGSWNIMANFKTFNPEEVKSYIEYRLKCEIVKVSE